MPVVNLVPLSATSRDTGSGGNAWAPEGAEPLRNLDGICMQAFQSPNPDSQSLDGQTWVDASTGMTVDWSNKQMTEIVLFGAGIITAGPSCWLAINMTNSSFMTPQQVYDQNVPWNSGSITEVELVRQNVGLGGWADLVRDWLIAANLLWSTIVSPRAGDVGVRIDRTLIAVVYNDIVPPVTAPMGIAMEL